MIICYLFTGIAHRPRRIIVFVNPFGGKKKGNKIWEKQVQPLMKIAGVETKTIITERAGHIHDCLLNSNLDDIEVYYFFFCTQ